MKILQLCFSNSLGGNELYLERIGPALANKGHEVGYALRKNSHLARRITGESIMLFDPVIPYADIFSALKLARFARRLGAEVLHVHHSHDLFYAAVAKALNPGLKVVYTRQMLPGGPKRDLFHRWVYGKIDLVIASTQQMQGQLSERLPIAAGRIQCLYLGTTLPDLTAKPANRSQIRSTYGFSDSDFVILFPNRIDPQKGQLLLIEALTILCSKGLTPKVLFIGKETEDCAGFAKVLRSAVDAAGLSGSCTIAGFINNPSPFFAAADITVLATRAETFGMVLIESMAWGTPVIGSAAGGVPEIIEHGRNGYLFRSMDAVSLAEAIEQCLLNRETLPELGRIGRKTVEEKFDFTKHLEALEKYYRE